MNFEEWWDKIGSEQYEQYYCAKSCGKESWNSCKKEAIKIIKSKYPKYVGDLIYEDGWDTACMSIEEEIEKL